MANIEERKAAYEKKREELNKRCDICRKQNRIFKPTAERCSSCTVGQRLRWLQTEYSDVTGWSHEKTWNKVGM